MPRATWLVALLLPLVVRSGESTICSLVKEGEPTLLECPAGRVIESIETAVFGEFANGTSCPAPEVTELCPVVALAPIRLLCEGNASCAVNCRCNADNSPACACGTVGGPLLGMPVFPCPDVKKQLAVTARCGPLLPSFDPPAHVSSPRAAPSDLRLEFMMSPVLGLDELMPHFGWVPPSPASPRGAPAQAAFKVTVSGMDGTTVWTSGRVEGTAALFVPETPLPLVSDTMYSWTVTTWPQDTAAASVDSEQATFTTGLLAQSDWAPARWVSAGRCDPSPVYVDKSAMTAGNCSGGLLRKTFNVAEDQKIGRVSVFISACQYYELYIDGQRVGDRRLDVVWTRFDRNRTYATYNIDPALLPPGDHALGLWIGQGFCGEEAAAPKNTGQREALLLMSMHAADDNGTVVQTIATDETWLSGQSPLLYENPYNGEVYDQSEEQPGWASSSFEPAAGRAWPAATPLAAPGAPGSPWLRAQTQPPMRAVHEIRALTARRVLDSPGKEQPADPARWTFDFGQEFSGHVRLTLPAGVPAGTKVTLKFAEVLSHPPLKLVVNGTVMQQQVPYDGSVYMGNLFWARPVDVFRVGAQGEKSGAVYEPRFTFHGFRYVELSASPPFPQEVAQQITIDTLMGVNVRTDAREQARVRIANPLLQRLYNNSWWTEASGLMGIPSGAGARGERGGWTGDAAIAAESESFDFDTGAFFVQYLGQIEAQQCQLDGSIPHSIPYGDPNRDSVGKWADVATCKDIGLDPSWSTVLPQVAWNVWRYYNATGAVRKRWPTILKYMNYLEGKVNATGIATTYCQWGDHQQLAKTPCHLTAATTYVRDLGRVAEMAAAIGDEAAEAEFTAKAKAALDQYRSAFWDESTKTSSEGTQAAQAMALVIGAVPEADRAGVAERLGQDLVKNGVTVGFLGASFLFQALSLANRTDLAVQGLLREAYPGYGYAIYTSFEPSTSLWESWDCDTRPQWHAESSRSHHFQSHIATYLRRFIAGLDMPSGRAAAWTTVRVRPEAAALPAGVSSLVPAAEARVETHRGSVGVRWQRSDGPSAWVNVTVPPSSAGEIHVPLLAGDSTVVRESGSDVWRSGKFVSGVDGVLSAQSDGRFVVFYTRGGEYAFETSVGGQ